MLWLAGDLGGEFGAGGNSHIHSLALSHLSQVVRQVFKHAVEIPAMPPALPPQILQGLRDRAKATSQDQSTQHIGTTKRGSGNLSPKHQRTSICQCSQQTHQHLVSQRNMKSRQHVQGQKSSRGVKVHALHVADMGQSPESCVPLRTIS